MTFGWTGNATVCCCNRKEVLGTYPKDSLIDMWRGSGVRAMREAMAAFSPPPGCHVCVQQAEIRNFGGMRAFFFDEVGDEPFPASQDDLWPQMMEFEISNL